MLALVLPKLTGFAPEPEPTVANTFASSLDFAKQANCPGLHDSPTYFSDLAATYSAHDLGHGKTWEQSQEEVAKHTAAVTEDQKALLESCMSSPLNERRLVELTLAQRVELAKAMGSVPTHRTVGDALAQTTSAQKAAILTQAASQPQIAISLLGRL